MKAKLLLLALIITTSVFGQENDKQVPRISGDTLITSCGYKIIKRQEIKIGTGSTPDGDFRFIRISSNSLFHNSASNSAFNGLTNQSNALPRDKSGLKFKIKSIENRGNKKHGDLFYAKIVLGLTGYEIDVENAIASGEIAVPDEFKPKPKTTVVEVKQQVSVADELIKLKKLYDDGVLTKDEYTTQKNKLLNK